MIGDDVVVTVLGVQGNQVKIGIDAPKHIRVDREEIYRKIQAEKQAKAAEAANAEKKQHPQYEYSAQPAANANNSYNSSVVTSLDYNDSYMVPKSPRSQPEIIVKKKKVLSGQEA